MTLNIKSAEAPRLAREIAELQRFVAELPDRDPRSPDEVLVYGSAGLPE